MHAGVRGNHIAQAPDITEKSPLVGPLIISGKLPFAITTVSELSTQTNIRSATMTARVLVRVNHTLAHTALLIRCVYFILREESTLHMSRRPCDDSNAAALMASPSYRWVDSKIESSNVSHHYILYIM